MPDNHKRDQLMRRLLSPSPFFYALLPTLLFYFVILESNWIPIHDTFQHSNIAYLAFNEIVRNNELPLWYPYATFGVDNQWLLAPSIGPALASLLPVARLFDSANFLSFYYMALLLDEIALLVGVYLLSRFLFANVWTSIFVCIALTGSTLWYGQVWWNFHLYYFLPLSMFYLASGCLQNSAWRILFGGALTCATSFGNLAYFPIIQGLTLGIFLGAAAWAYRLNVSVMLASVGWRELLALVSLILPAGLSLIISFYGVDHVNYNVGRSGQNNVSLENFLTYGSATGFSKFSELFTGTAWSINLSVYAGLLVSVMALYGLIWWPDRRQVPFLVTGLFLLLLSLGPSSFVASLVYFLPGMNYFRHVGSVLPIIKVMLVFLAGFGFDSLATCLLGSAATEHRRAALINVGILSAMLAIACILTFLSLLSTVRFNQVHIFYGEITSRFASVVEFSGAIVFEIFVYACLALCFLFILVGDQKRGRIALVCLLLVHVIDVYSFRFSQYYGGMWRPSEKVANDFIELYDFRDIPFASTRIDDYWKHSKYKTMVHYLGEEPTWKRTGEECKSEYCAQIRAPRHGAYYGSIDSFLGIDPCRSAFRTDWWLQGVDQLYRAHMGLAIEKGRNVFVLRDTGGNIFFPKGNASLDQATGCGVSKIQVFSRLAVAKDDAEAARLMNGLESQSRGGYLPLVTEAQFQSFMGDVTADMSPDSESFIRVDSVPILASNDQVDVLTHVKRFTANSLELDVRAPDGVRNYWLYYADAWHSFWRASVNGQAVPILAANLAFKAVPIPSGHSTVQFVFDPPGLRALMVGAGVILIGLMLWILWCAKECLAGREFRVMGTHASHEGNKMDRI